MALRHKLTDIDMEAISGGVHINNDWGDGTVYKIGKNGEDYTHTFNESDLGNVSNIVSETYDPNLSDDDNETAIMQALIDSPYLSPL